MSQKHHPELISIILVNYNGLQWLERCLTSVFSQDYPHFEVVLAENCSTDGSQEYLQKTWGDKIILVGTERNGGFSYGNNRAVEHAKGSLLLFLNTDTWLEPTELSTMHARYTSSGTDIYGVCERNYDIPQVGVPFKIKPDLLGHPVYRPNPERTPWESFYVPGSCFLVSAGFYRSVGGLDEDFFMYFEETDFMWRARLYGGKIYHDQELFIHHAGVDRPLGISYNSFLWRNQNCPAMLLKNYSGLALCFILPWYAVQNFIEMLFFLVLLKPKISKTYVLGFWHNLKMLPKTLAKRREIQGRRVISDRALLPLVYLGSAKFNSLVGFAKHLVSKKEPAA